MISSITETNLLNRSEDLSGLLLGTHFFGSPLAGLAGSEWAVAWYSFLSFRRLRYVSGGISGFRLPTYTIVPGVDRI